MSFMQQQITNRRDWIEIDTANGTVFVDAADAPEVMAIINDTEAWDADEDAQDAALTSAAFPYTEVHLSKYVFSVQTVRGFGARMSAPGYMDCTEWSVFDTEDEAQAYLDETYGDDEDEDEDDNDE